ncbi:hypothetical protein RND81_09G182900 [Saponaria officinalis]|uniref:Nonsense-mediated mRNA decay factor SMG8 n=1 Tax=Saponaria officinalis TaxID=3572 RepID=A0AAW1IPA0_SAPOF
MDNTTTMKSKTPNLNTSTSMRVLTRPPPSPPPPQQPPQPPPLSQPSQPPPSSTGVVVIGFIGRRHSDVSELLNRILDAQIFGSSRPLDTPLRVPVDDEVSDGVKEWFDRRSISYYHDRDKGVVFLQSSSLNCPAMVSVFEFDDSVVDDREFGDLQAMLFMFTVCHVIIYIQEGSRFDTQFLKTLRVLQPAKNALAPFLRSHNILPSHSRPSSSSSRPTQATSSKSPSPRRGSSISNRNNSPVSIMSGLGLSPALFPGQCTPIALFAFIDDFSEMVNSSAAAEESNDASKSSQSGLSSMVRSNQSMKGSNSVVVLSRPADKSESSLSKKLLSSLETQIRFLIKKCRVLTSSENSSHTGTRGGGISGSAPLLTLDSSRAVVLLDTSGIRRGSSLDFATSLVDDVVSGNIISDSLLLESHSQSGLKEDILTLKEFVYRQADILRGKGGLVTAAGVGMVAVAAAAAAAASAASGRPTTIPELPGLEVWLSSSLLILKGILLGKPGSLDEIDAIRRRSRSRNGVPPLVEGGAARAVDSPDIAISILDNGKGINRKFSSLWCQRALPAAKEIYLKDLPPCYPTSQHQAQLDKALLAFLSMVKGPSVQEFAKKLQEECLSIWMSGRQLCDAISLTGKPCMHQRHDIENDDVAVEAMGKEHSSGFVFLHACACGRSRKLRADPFDFEAANIKFNTFSDCDNLLPMLQLPKMNDSRSIQPFPWTVVRLGGSRYYEPSKGLLQAGFSPREKFLLRWTIVVEHDNPPSVSFANALRQGSASSKADLKIVSAEAEDAKKNNRALVQLGEVQSGVEGHGKAMNVSHSENKISFGRGLPNLIMKKAFSEVVAGSNSSNSAFPPLQPKAQLLYGPGKGGKKKAAKVTSIAQSNISSGNFQISGISEETSSAGAENSKASSNNSHSDGNPLLHIGRNVIPLSVDDANNALDVNVADGGKSRFSPTCRHFVVYVGFEHECPRGHRFILSPEILNQLGQPDCFPEESIISRPVEHNNRKHRGSVRLGKSDGHNKVPGLSNGKNVDMEKVSNLKLPTEAGATGDPAVNGLSHLFNPLEHTTLDSSNSFLDLQQNPHSINCNDNGPAFSLLNRNIPIYLKCPHCSASKNKDTQNLKFAGTISQLQRIFVVTPPFPIVVAANPVVHFEQPVPVCCDILVSLMPPNGNTFIPEWPSLSYCLRCKD